MRASDDFSGGEGGACGSCSKNASLVRGFEGTFMSGRCTAGTTESVGGEGCEWNFALIADSFGCPGDTLSERLVLSVLSAGFVQDSIFQFVYYGVPCL